MIWRVRQGYRIWNIFNASAIVYAIELGVGGEGWGITGLLETIPPTLNLIGI